MRRLWRVPVRGVGPVPPQRAGPVAGHAADLVPHMGPRSRTGHRDWHRHRCCRHRRRQGRNWPARAGDPRPAASRPIGRRRATPDAARCRDHLLPAAHRQHVDHRTRSPSRTPWRLTSRRVTHRAAQPEPAPTRNDLEPAAHRHVALVPTTLGRAFRVHPCADAQQEPSNETVRAMRLAGSYHLQVAATEDDDRSAWDAFLVKVPRAPYQQSSLWAKVMAGQGWRSARMTVTRDGSIHSGAQLLYKRSRSPGRSAGRPRPHPRIRRSGAGRDRREGLQRLAAACNMIYLIVQPPRGARGHGAPSPPGRVPDRARDHGATQHHDGCTGPSPGEAALRAAMRKSPRRNVRLAHRRARSSRGRPG